MVTIKPSLTTKNSIPKECHIPKKKTQQTFVYFVPSHKQPQPLVLSRSPPAVSGMLARPEEPLSDGGPAKFRENDNGTGLGASSRGRPQWFRGRVPSGVGADGRGRGAGPPSNSPTPTGPPFVPGETRLPQQKPAGACLPWTLGSQRQGLDRGVVRRPPARTQLKLP